SARAITASHTRFPATPDVLLHCDNATGSRSPARNVVPAPSQSFIILICIAGGTAMDRRDFLKTASLSALAAGMLPAAGAMAADMDHAMSSAPSVPLTGKAEYTLRIATGVLELAPTVRLDHTVQRR